MPPTKNPAVSPRKAPRQQRSEALVEALLEAALRVLTRHGEGAFNTVRVAQEAGVSIGSLYQYFPNKAALLFRLQSDEWDDTLALLEDLLGDTSLAPRDRLERAVVTFFRSELEEAELRSALARAAGDLRDHPDAASHRTRAHAVVRRFVDEVCPSATQEDRGVASELVATTLSALGERLTRDPVSRARIDGYARATAVMLWAYVKELGPAS